MITRHRVGVITFLFSNNCSCPRIRSGSFHARKRNTISCNVRLTSTFLSVSLANSWISDSNVASVFLACFSMLLSRGLLTLAHS